MHILVVTGISGAGKATTKKALEDLDYFCADNIPLPLAGHFVSLLESVKKAHKVAMVIDCREKEFLGNHTKVFEDIRQSGHQIEILFLDANDNRIVQRFSETRRKHPLGDDDLRSGIAQERKLLALLRENADTVMDTSNLTVHQLSGIIQERYGSKDKTLAVTLLSFGFKYGLPTESDLVFDARFLPNPYFEKELTHRSGKDTEVRDFVLNREDSQQYLKHLVDLLAFLIPRFDAEGKSYLTIALGCTGGRHRSVALVEEIHKTIGGKWGITLRHRDMHKAELSQRSKV